MCFCKDELTSHSPKTLGGLSSVGWGRCILCRRSSRQNADFIIVEISCAYVYVGKFCWNSQMWRPLTWTQGSGSPAVSDAHPASPRQWEHSPNSILLFCQNCLCWIRAGEGRIQGGVKTPTAETWPRGAGTQTLQRHGLVIHTADKPQAFGENNTTAKFQCVAGSRL